MVSYALRLYELLRPRPWLRWTLGLVVVLLLVARLSTLHFKEDITDFLPNDGHYPASLAAFGQYNGGNRIFAVVRAEKAQPDGEETLIAAADRFAEIVRERDTARWFSQVMSEIDVERVMHAQQWWVAHAPYLLKPSDVARIDSLVRTPHFVKNRLETAQSEMMLPTSGWQTATLAQDPLGILSAPATRLLAMRTNLHYDLHEGHIFSPNHRLCVVMLTTNAQGTATDVQARLKQLLEEVGKEVEDAAEAGSIAAEKAQLRVQIIGAPTIAVGNAEQIKRDSTWAIAIAVVLTLAILVYTLRRARHLLLIVVAVSFGWLVGLATLSFTTSSVSLIVLGISSVIIGIAVNYPLHFLTHLPHAGSIRRNLRELVAPLLIGNVTTVGAFAALIPLHSVALRDLGVFAAAMLVGTIGFVLVALPHLVKNPKSAEKIVEELPTSADLEATFAPENRAQLHAPRKAFPPHSRRFALVLALVATLFLGWTGRNVEFDANLSHLNYMPKETQQLFSELAQLRQADTLSEPLYITHRAATLDEAIALLERAAGTLYKVVAQVHGAQTQSVAPYLASAREQKVRLAAWQGFVEKNGDKLRQEVATSAAQLGFAPEAFAPFDSMMLGDFAPIAATDVLKMGEDALAPLVARDGLGHFWVTTVVHVPRGSAERVKTQLDAALTRADLPQKEETAVWTFTPKTMNESVARHLSQDFSYIGWVCGAIVFGFLWLSFRRLSIALLAFFPMVVSWLWILGTMSLFDLSFNLVNVILATFIFGQGDDYSIFVTEGLLYEYTYGRTLLKAYQRSILLSAIIMLIGVGTLAFAQHPALSSLGRLTIVGMGSVVGATLLLPAPVFAWWTRKGVASPWASPLTFVRLVQSMLSRNAWTLSHCCGIAWDDRTEQVGANPEALPIADESPHWIGVWTAQDARTKLWAMQQHPQWKWLELSDLTVENCHALWQQGLQPMVDFPLADAAQRAFWQTLAKMPQKTVRPLVVEGEERVFPCGTRVVEHGRIVLAWGEMFEFADISETALETTTLKIGTSDDLTRNWQAHYAQARATLMEVSALVPHVVASYSHKLDGIQARVAHRLAYVPAIEAQLDAWRSEMMDKSTKVAFVLHVVDDGEMALLMALLHPSRQFVALFVEEDGADVLSTLRCRPKNLQVKLIPRESVVLLSPNGETLG